MFDKPKNEDLAALTQAAARAAETVASLTLDVEAAERVKKAADDSRNSAIKTGESGEPIRRLAAASDEAARKLASRRQDLTQAVEAARMAAAARESARFSGQVAGLSAQLATAARTLEVALRALAEGWTAFETLDAAAAVLNRELVAARRRYKIALPEPSAGVADLTSDLYVLAGEAGPALRVLDAQREEAAHPTPPPKSEGYPFMIAGDSERGRAQRVRMAEVETERAKVARGR